MKVAKITIEDVETRLQQFGGQAVPYIRKNCIVLHLEDGSKRLLSDGYGEAEALPYPEQSQPQLQPVALLNASILTPREGTIRQSRISEEDARKLIAERGFISAIGHQATADAFTELIGQPVRLDRIEFEQAVGQSAIVLRLRARPPEGAILNREEMERIGFDLLLMERIA